MRPTLASLAINPAARRCATLCALQEVGYSWGKKLSQVKGMEMLPTMSIHGSGDHGCPRGAQVRRGWRSVGRRS